MAYEVSTSTNLLANNVFIAELSDSLDSFANATVIGTKMDTIRNGTIAITIPSGLKVGNNYSIRLRASSDALAFATPYPITVLPGFSQATIVSASNSNCKGRLLSGLSMAMY